MSLLVVAVAVVLFLAAAVVLGVILHRHRLRLLRQLDIQ
jgi:hypothetical protein